MRTLGEIVEATRNGERPDYEDLRYAVCALEALGVFDREELIRNARDEQKRRGDKNGVATMRWEESFRRSKEAYGRSPKEWVGWNNGPDNPEFRERRAAAIRLFEKIAG